MSRVLLLVLQGELARKNSANEKMMKKMKMLKLKNGECYATVDGLQVVCLVTVDAS
jgi:hypothetical protein